jgi:hypothetical protein
MAIIASGERGIAVPSHKGNSGPSAGLVDPAGIKWELLTACLAGWLVTTKKRKGEATVRASPSSCR